MKYLKPAIGFHAWNGTPHPVEGAGLIRFQSTLTNVGGCYSTSTGQFTAPVKGIYHFACTGLVRRISGGGSGEITYYYTPVSTGTAVNLSSLGRTSGARSFGYAYVPNIASDHDTLESIVTFEMEAGDKIEPRAHSVSGPVDIYVAANLANFVGHLVRLT